MNVGDLVRYCDGLDSSILPSVGVVKSVEDSWVHVCWAVGFMSWVFEIDLEVVNENR